MQKISDHNRIIQHIIISVVMTDLTQTCFSVNENDFIVTNTYIRLNIAGDNKKLVFIPWRQIKELTIEEVYNDGN